VGGGGPCPRGRHELKRLIDLRQTPPASRATQGVEASPQDARRVLNSHAFAFITVVNSETQYATCVRYIDALQVPPGYSVEKIAVFGATSMAEGCQRGMETSTARYKVYLHQDLYLVYRGLLSELLHLFRMYPRLGLVGVEGATRLPAAVLYSMNNPFHCYGRHWTYRRPGGISSLFGPANRRRLHFNRFRSFAGDYMPAVVVDGFFMATQYDMPWTSPLGGFELYDKVRAVEFITAGLEVGIARQQMTWCFHRGPLQEPTSQQRLHRHSDLQRKVAAFRQLYQSFVRVPARSLYEQYRGRALVHHNTGPQSFGSSHPARERLGVAIVAVNGQEMVLRALRALLPQCEALKDLGYQVVVVDHTSTAGVSEAVRRESAKVTVAASASDSGLASAFNTGLRELGFPSFILIMRDDAELSDGTLARMVSYLGEHPSTAGVIASLIDPDGTIVGTTRALVRGEVFFDVGLYDDRFLSCHEDRDWSIRARRKGYTFTYLPQARVLCHHRSQRRRVGPAGFAERAVDDLWLTYKHVGRQWAVLLYWVQWMRARWLALRWRHDRDALRQIGGAMAQTTSLYRKFREENRRPELL